ncbi:phage holin family protein [Tardiphaga robiniae]|uniref:Phage holin family protein n=1 Tax=Tardiphaga robiniae TaxID=943830 RepID=A0A7G6U9N1_9BRAD|nr:phage holin family protein [Tardiphaga robiniae]
MRTGLALKLNQVKRATSSYIRDRSEQTQGIAVSYAVAAGLYAAAGVFLIATLLVGATALFRWIELRYGLFQAFGATGGLLLVLAALFAILAASRLKRPTKQFPSLGSRLRVAINANPGKHEQQVTSAAPHRTAAPNEFRPSTRPAQPLPNNGPVKAGLVLAATLAGWAFARRRSLAQPAPARRPASKANA